MCQSTTSQLMNQRKLTLLNVLFCCKVAQKYPLVNALWYPDAQITANGFVHKMNTFLFQWIPAIIIDFLLLCCFQERLSVVKYH